MIYLVHCIKTDIEISKIYLHKHDLLAWFHRPSIFVFCLLLLNCTEALCAVLESDLG